ALILPWLSLQSYYSSSFIPVSLGLQNKSEFYLDKIALYEDYQNLDRILPPNAALLIDGIRINSVYSSRPVYLNLVDVPPDKSLFLLRANSRTELYKRDVLRETLLDYEIGEKVYANPNAVTQVYRVPGKTNGRKNLEVFAMTRKE
ncbi:MAG: hypothetical protein SAJ37_15560, partial [Oscillatoria sp. PMC 1068.18]|nr:hypothetical protein [Oscillatoria sp. PMC 1076.18]MEC4990150.1 hypothetical protein [Oscillatoria sp. PMC 1068.18]